MPHISNEDLQKEKRIKCRFCSVTFARWRTNKKGDRVGPWDAINTHMAIKHYQQYAELDDALALLPKDGEEG